MAMELLGPEYLPYAEQYRTKYGEAKMVRSPGIAKVAKSPKGLGPTIPTFPMSPNIKIIRITGTKTQPTVINIPQQRTIIPQPQTAIMPEPQTMGSPFLFPSPGLYTSPKK
jgi:hypothetical protein